MSSRTKQVYGQPSEWCKEKVHSIINLNYVDLKQVGSNKSRYLCKPIVNSIAAIQSGGQLHTETIEALKHCRKSGNLKLNVFTYNLVQRNPEWRSKLRVNKNWQAQNWQICLALMTASYKFYQF